MKSNYLKPTTIVVEIQQKCHLLADSIQSVTNNANLNFRGAGDAEARSREAKFDDGEWFDEE